MKRMRTADKLGDNDQVVIWQGDTGDFASIPQAEFLDGVKDQIDLTPLDNRVSELEVDVGELQSTRTHNNLLDRDANDAHPISSITGLQGNLNNLVTLDSEQTITAVKNFSVLNATDGSGIEKIQASNIEGTIDPTTLPAATESVAGIAKVATIEEVRNVLLDDKFLTPKKFGDSSFGWSQTWKDKTVDYTAGTEYTNSTGRPIQINLMAQHYGNGYALAELYVATKLVARNMVRYSENEKVAFVTATVPNGTKFKYEVIIGGGGVFTVMELS